LFFESLGNEAGARPVWIGFLVGSFVIIIVGIAIIKYVKKIPLQYFFSITGFFLSMLAIIFTGAGIRGLQTANLVSVTPSELLPKSELLAQYFGYYPTVETALAQLAVMTLLSGFFLFSKFNSSQRRSAKIKGK
jgi:high-affinity iron transporter